MPRWIRFPLMGVGRKRKITNLMSSTSANFQLNIFDYSYVTGRGRSQTQSQANGSVFAIATALAMPNFTLAPKRFLGCGAQPAGQTNCATRRQPGVCQFLRAPVQ